MFLNEIFFYLSIFLKHFNSNKSTKSCQNRIQVFIILYPFPASNTFPSTCRFSLTLSESKNQPPSPLKKTLTRPSWERQPRRYRRQRRWLLPAQLQPYPFGSWWDAASEGWRWHGEGRLRADPHGTGWPSSCWQSSSAYDAVPP